jgi:hypothetical protein
MVLSNGFGKSKFRLFSLSLEVYCGRFLSGDSPVRRTTCMSSRLLAFSHQTQLKLGARKFTTQVTLGTGDQLHVTADNGAFGRVQAGQKTLNLSGGDDAGRTFTLTVEGTSAGHGRGTLTVGSFVFTDSGELKGMTERLLGKVSPEAKKMVPRGVTLLPYAKWLRKNRQATAVTVGHSARKAVGEEGTYCKSVCSCCEKGSWLSAWCCISCASCDYFKNPLQSLPEALA